MVLVQNDVLQHLRMHVADSILLANPCRDLFDLGHICDYKGKVAEGPATDSFDLCRFEGGKFVEHWGIVDRLGMMGQLSLIPPPGGGRGQRRQT